MENNGTQFVITRRNVVSHHLRRFGLECLACGTRYVDISSNELTRAVILHTGPARGHGTIDGKYVDIDGAEFDASLWFDLPRTVDEKAERMREDASAL